MDLNNLPTAEIIASNVDIQPINNAIKQRAEALAGQMNEEAAEQFCSDMKEIECSVKASGDELSFSVSPSETYLLNYLKNHGTPVTGGDDGTAHNVDGSTYTSRVPKALQGIELPWLELPTLDGEDEAKQIVSLMARDAGQEAVRRSTSQIKEAVMPSVKKEVYQMLGGGLT